MSASRIRNYHEVKDNLTYERGVHSLGEAHIPLIVFEKWHVDREQVNELHNHDQAFVEVHVSDLFPDVEAAHLQLDFFFTVNVDV